MAIMNTLQRLVENLRQDEYIRTKLETGYSPTEFGGDGAEFAVLELPSCKFQILPYTEYDFRLRITFDDGRSYFSGETWVPTENAAIQDKALAKGIRALLKAATEDASNLVDGGLETTIGYVYFD